MINVNPRSLATRRVMKTIARRAHEQPLPVRRPDGTFPVIVALPDDTVVDVGDQVARSGDRANVFVAFDSDLVLIEFVVQHGAPDQDAQVAHEATSMAMYVELLKLDPTHSCTVSISRDSAATAPSLRRVAYAF